MSESKMSKLAPMDEGKSNDIALYMIDIPIDGEQYGAEVPARNAGEALAIAKKLKGVVIGRVTDERSEKICSVCANEFPMVNKEDVQPIPEEIWPEDIN